MAWINPLYEEHQRRRWLRHDWQRFLTPAGLEAEKRAAEERARAVLATEQKAFEDELWQVRRDLDALKVELAARRAARRQEAEALRRKSDLAWDQFFRTFKRYAAQQEAGFNAEQPRVPAGNPDGGQWTGDAGKEGADQVQSDEIGASKKADIVRQFGKWTARQFVSRYCRGSINREMPGEFENATIADIYDIAKGGDARARTCLKLLKEPRFRK